MATRNSTSKRRKPLNRKQSRAKRPRLAEERKQLFEAIGIIQTSRHALASQLEGLDGTSVIDALQAASAIIDEVAAALAPDPPSELESAAVLP